jgi:hypothetical protein
MPARAIGDQVGPEVSGDAYLAPSAEQTGPFRVIARPRFVRGYPPSGERGSTGRPVDCGQEQSEIELRVRWP